MWAVWVRTALDSADAAASAAIIVSARDMKAAGDLLDQASKIRATGRSSGVSGSVSNDTEAIAEWERVHGGSMDDPVIREKIYKALADSRKLEAAEAEKAARSKMAGQAGTQKLKKRRRRG